HQLEGEGGIQNDGLYYFIPSDASKNENTQLLRDNLNL
ncbi:MAG: LytR family transcriptional regulator, partial [Staphylococcus epidermidis]|nr:LytR family transcriptional regulator [Staphylococcus epidermidis]MDU1965816.1 LytR family transcriptional regulator [Staphylococcus lugdunensis]MDU3000331.1 LytR family transcriptional regulator [Staphylococcus sp.]MDU5411066.1 LytR family transcriptional regulator [Staphylococcus haemolyticus]MDU1282700.1 LytR family transcriptional regulator [Staphylococcus epidermidis]